MKSQGRVNIDNLKPLLADYLINKKGINNLKEHFTCLNPNHIDHHPSMSYTPKYNICKCFSCGAKYDLFDLIGLDYNVNTFKEELEIANELYPNVNIDLPKLFTVYSSAEENNVIDFTNYYDKCSKQINQTDYLSTRSIDLSLIDKYHIGYDNKRNMMVFPINKYCYFGRGVNSNIKLKSKGISYLWNEDLLKDNDNNLIYITESIIDSLSLETINRDVKTVALNGLPNYKRLLKIIEEDNYSGNLVLAFDNDKTGLAYQEIVKNELDNLGVRSFSITLISSIEGVKDINEALMSNREKLEKSFKYFDDNLKKICEKSTEGELDL